MQINWYISFVCLDFTRWGLTVFLLSCKNNLNTELPNSVRPRCTYLDMCFLREKKMIRKHVHRYLRYNATCKWPHGFKKVTSVTTQCVCLLTSYIHVTKMENKLNSLGDKLVTSKNECQIKSQFWFLRQYCCQLSVLSLS